MGGDNFKGVEDEVIDGNTKITDEVAVAPIEEGIRGEVEVSTEAIEPVVAPEASV